jgi:hypothetical protein
MLNRSKTGALAGLAISLSLATAVRAATVTFDDRTFTPDPIGHTYGAQETSNGFTEQGLHFYTDQGFVIPTQLSCVVSDPTCDPVFPATFSSNFWETYGEDVVFTLPGNGLFDFKSLNVGLGVGYPDEPGSDTVKLSWVKDGVSHSEDLTLGLGFGFHQFEGLNGVSSVTIGPTNVRRYLAFDDISFVDDSAAVPEPAAWAMMIAGFVGVGAMIRRRRSPAPAAAA